MRSIFSNPWFYGYLSIKEAELLLIQQGVGTFLVRLDHTSPWNFAFAFVYAPRHVIHILVNSRQPLGYGIFDEESGQERLFKTLNDIISGYRQVLLHPYQSTLCLQPYYY